MPGKLKETFSLQKKNFTDKINQVEKVIRTKLILVIVANTIDPEIGKGCREDIKSIRHMFNKLSHHMEFNFLELLVKGADYTKKNILDAIDSLTPGTNDIVVFYYSGHGFSYKKEKEKKFPQVDLRSHPASNKIAVINENTNNLMEVFEMVKSKGARLNIVIGDCCNSTIKFKRNFKRSDDTVRLTKRRPVIINKKMCETLFCDYTASILVAAADKGQYAVSDEKLGSIFTLNFTNNLKILMKKSVDEQNGLPWNKLLEETQEKTLHLSKTYDIGNGKPGYQKAIFDIHLKQSL
ncbi:MAG: caspase family protein, partial [Bacteroidota bacterium]